MQFATSVPWWVLALGVALAAVVAYGAYRQSAVPLSFWRRLLLVDLRAAALLLVFLFLLQPVRSAPGPAGGAVVAVLVDHSRSMAIADAAGASRLAQAVALVRDQLLPELSPRAEVELFGFGDRLFETTLDAAEADARRTDLAGALEEVAVRLAGRPLAGVVVVSDGGETGARSAARVAADSGSRLFAIGVGAPQPGPDREVVSVTAGHPPAAQSVVDLTAAVASHALGGAAFEVRLLGDGRLLDRRLVTPPGAGAPARVVFRVRPDPEAATLYTVEVPAAAGELVAGNNRRRVLVPPPPRPRRLLLIEGAPSYEHTFLKRVWQADPGLVLDAVIRKGMNDLGEQTFYVQGDPARTAALGTGFPADREALFAYDAIVLANVEADYFRVRQLELAAAFVADRGAGLLSLGDATLSRGGWGASALAPVLPVALVDPGRGAEYGSAGGGGEASGDGGDALALTAEGARHPIMRLAATPEESRERWRAVPGLAGAVAVGGPRPGATLLAVTPALPGRPAQPLIAIQRYGAGRAMVFAGRAAWRWRMRMPAEDRTYEVFWGQVARWLTGSARDPVTVASSGGDAPGDMLEIDLLVRDEAFVPVPDASPAVSVTGPDGAARRVRPELVDAAEGRYRAEVRPAEPGVYRIDAVVDRGAERLGAATDWALVGGTDAELADPWLNAPVLARTAAATGGRYVEPDGVGGLGASILDGFVVPPTRIPTPLWHNIWMFLWLVAVLAAEWGLRRRWGLR
ncbi:MAG: hypothetical protein OXH75_06120 [Acidobacteria bacterium]|nr:hypothetical protein [Acidobacteriota bacterium]